MCDGSPDMLTLALAAAMISTAPDGAIEYPKLQRSDASEEFFDVKVADPFRWLENVDSPEARNFVEKENAITAKWIPAPTAEAYGARLRELIDYPKRTLPERYGPWWFSYRNTGLLRQNILFKQRGEDGALEALIDPNTFSKDGTVALSAATFTEDGSLVAYAKSVGGSDNQTFHVREVESGRDRPDKLEDMRFSSVAWAADNSGFWYDKYPDPAQRLNSTVYWHRLGDPQKKDVAVFSMPKDPEVALSPGVTEDGKYLVVYATRGTDPRVGVWLRDAGGDAKRTGGFDEIFPIDRAEFEIVGNDGPVFYVYTDLDAPGRRLISVDVRHPALKNVRELIPQEPNVLNNVSMIGDSFVATYTRDLLSEMRIYAKDGRFLHGVPLPSPGTAAGVSGRRAGSDFFFLFSNYTTPGTIFRCEVPDGKLSDYYHSKIKFDASRYVTEQAFYKSRDGTHIPICIAYRKGLKRDGGNPVLLTGYGGFGVSMEPGFDPFIVPWLEQGGVYAVAGLRGGGEYGTAWHEAGMFGRKQNVFDDFIAAGQKLIDDKFTTPAKLGIKGGSNGGLLTAAVVLQRPDLFGAVVSQVPLIDMLRFQRFGTGRFWTAEYGDATASREAFEWLRKYSPLQNVKAGAKYPPTLVTTANGDDRVVPLHAFKFVATLQSDAAPGVYLLRHEMGAGHGGGKPLDMEINEEAAVYAFLTRALDLPAPDFHAPPGDKASAAR